MLFNVNEPDQNKETQTPEEAAKVDRAIRLLTIVAAALALVFLVNMLAQNIIRPSLNYNSGVSAMQDGRYDDAMNAFARAGDYKDAADQLLKARQKHADALAGKENALSYLSTTCPWFSVDESGMFAFAKDDYEDAEEFLPNPGEILIPDVLDGVLITSLKEKTFLNADTVTSIVIPDAVTALPDSLFYNCTALKTVTLPKNLTVIAQRAFINCAALESLVLPETVKEIGLRAFNNCYLLKTVTISGNLVHTIQPYTFSDCYSLETVTVPASVETIAENAFLNCESLKTVYFGGTEAQWNAITVGEGNEALAGATVVFGK